MVEGIQVGCGAINDTKVVATVDEVRGSDDCWANHENLARGPPPERARCHWPRHEHRVFWQFLERPAKGQPPGHVFLSVAVVKTMLSCTKSHSNVLLLKTRLRRPGHETRGTRHEKRDTRREVRCYPKQLQSASRVQRVYRFNSRPMEVLYPEHSFLPS